MMRIDTSTWSIDVGKILVLTLLVISFSTLGAIGVIDGDNVETLLLILTGYVVGNGVNAARHRPSKGILSEDQPDSP